MTPRDFDPCDPATWPMVLTAEQTAAIYQRKVSGLKKACQRHTFIPAPFQVRPYLWRKVDVLRDLEGAQPLRRTA